MPKPQTLHDLWTAKHVSLHELEKIARDIFDGQTTMAGPEGYVVTACNFDDLSDSCKQFVVKAILAFPVENVLDAGINDEEENPYLEDEHIQRLGDDTVG